VVEGRPPVVPPRRAAEPVPEPALPATVTAADPPPEAAPEAFPQPDPRLAGARPRLRPAEASTTPGPEPDEESAITAAPPPGAILVASPVPRGRPAAIVALDPAPVGAAATEGEVSALAVAISRKPAPRPATLTARAVPAAAPAAPAAAARRAPPPAADDPEAIEDGEEAIVAAAAAPSRPTTASVARQATVTRALNLGTLNLIGVYGTANNRHALVRTPTGAFQRVRVGDRLDGGQVSAIGASELTISKGGRTVTLGMPRG
jgi:hypothetical protein